MKVEVYVVYLRIPTRKIKKVFAEIQTGKFSWAILSSGQRCLLGSSAFFTLAAAERCRTALLIKISKTQVLKFIRPALYYGACKQLTKEISGHRY